MNMERADCGIVEIDTIAHLPIKISMTEIDLFEHLCIAVGCEMLVDPDVNFKSDYTIAFDAESDEDELKVFNNKTGKVADDRGELYDILQRLGSIIIPNWENRL